MFEIKKSELRENVEAFAIAVLTILFINIFVFQSFIVKGPSMIPTLQDGERLIVNKFIYRFRAPRTGDIVIVKPPNDPEKKYIKRVIAGPFGSPSLYIQNSKTYVDGVELDEPYIKEKMEQDLESLVVPEGKIFVMGDNRNWSKDSRDPDVGFIPLENVVGKAEVIFWPPFQMKLLFSHKYKKIPTSSETHWLFHLPGQEY